jgi:tripartite-type tricarboxylate transporter receptor subunit TctC
VAKTSVLFAALLSGGVQFIASPSRAEDWPSRPVNMIIPFAPGGAFDIFGRVLAPRISEVLGRQIVIENVAGAGGVTAAVRVAKSPPDGYQFVLGDSSFAHSQALYKNPPYNTAADFAPVALLAEQPAVLIARNALPVNSLSEFVAYVKKNESTMRYGSAGPGSPTHLACLLLDLAIGVNITHVPYRGGAPAMQDVIAERLDYQCPILGTAVSQIEGRQVKPLAILTKNRSPRLPMLPSAHEQGLANFEASAWNAIFLPAGTPAAVVHKLHGAAVAAIETPAVQARLKDLGVTIVAPERQSPEYLKEFVAAEIKKWADPIKAARISFD